MDDQAPGDAIGRRIGAALIDLLICFVLLIVLGLLIGESESGGGSVSVNLEGGAALIYVLLVLGYFFAFEAASGRTIGKQLFGVRVVTIDGATPTPGRVAVRTVLRLVDGILFYAVGLVSVAVTRRRQRLGDLAAGTTVVRG
jgi:uncharacterized RDD family membrane protein YckC